MKLKDLKDRLSHAVETENPPGISYYGAEVDEDQVEIARERMDKAVRMHDELAADRKADESPTSRPQAP